MPQRKIKILIIDDSEFMDTVYSNKLTQDGYEVVLAADGEEGLQKIQTEKPDFIVLDGVLPKKSGFEVLQEIKKNSETKNIPVLALSNLETEADKWLNAGAIDYIMKVNFSLDEIIEKIEGWANKTSFLA